MEVLRSAVDVGTRSRVAHLAGARIFALVCLAACRNASTEGADISASASADPSAFVAAQDEAVCAPGAQPSSPVRLEAPDAATTPLEATQDGPRDGPSFGVLQRLRNVLRNSGDALAGGLGTIVGGILVTVLGTLAYDRVRRQVKLRVVSRPSRRIEQEVQSLYVERIESGDRVSPQFITHFLADPRNCVRGVRWFRRVTNRAGDLPPVLHLLLTAHSRGDLVGFVKAMYIRSTRVLFLAYAATQRGEGALERRTMQSMLERLRKYMTPGGPVDWVAFEVTDTVAPSANAKERLFRHYGQAHGLDIRRAALEYLQPDLDCIDLGHCREQTARLYLGRVGASASTIDSEHYRAIIRSIFFELYLPTWMLDNDVGREPARAQYVNDLLELIMHTAPSNIELV